MKPQWHKIRAVSATWFPSLIVPEGNAELGAGLGEAEIRRRANRGRHPGTIKIIAGSSPRVTDKTADRFDPKRAL